MAQAKENTVKIKLPKLRDGKNADVLVWVNERSWQIRRGVEVEVPECVEAVLRNSEYAEELADAYIEKRSNTDKTA